MKISEINPYIPLISNSNPNTMVFLNLPTSTTKSQSGEMANSFFYDLDDWCFGTYGEIYDAYSSGIFLLEINCSKPTVVGVLRMASTTPVPSYVVRNIWQNIAPGMQTSVLAAAPPQSLSDDIVRSTIELYRVDGIHVCNQAIVDL
jgi:hypothetical protein